MIFPKLDKESPVASTHEAASSASFVNGQDERDLAEDVESLTLDDEETDDEFLTDEEYDILDASDQEFTAEPQKLDQK
jgi:next-to-BRCA1 protein 1